MKQVFIRDGAAVVEDVPAPVAAAGEVLVRVRASCISVGTEMSGVRASDNPLWKRALEQPDKLLKVLEMVAARGVAATLSFVRGQVNAGLVTGYSAAGVVLECGAGVEDLDPGSRVACAGAQSAHHAEIVRVPRNLVARVPPDVEFADAATVTLGAIALQGVRRAEPTLGETFVVIGLGLLGQLSAQLLRANGCHVIGIDPDAARVKRARELGLDFGFALDAAALTADVLRLTGGYGADGVLVTAASRDPQLLNSAFALCRRKARVVLVGDVPIQIERAAIYANEIDFRISTSYGPGRYDRRYEEAGLDYPLPYVRWTENRNMEAYLALVAAGRVTPSRLIDLSCPIDEAARAYAALSATDEGCRRPLAALLDYPLRADEAVVARRLERSAQVATPRAGVIRVGLIGTGAFAQGTHLPNMAAMKDRFQVRAVMNRTGHVAHRVAAAEQAAYATTDVARVLADPEIDLVLISTRHDSHGELALRALAAGKHVFVEKPLTIVEGELARIEAFYAGPAATPPLLMTGFNRRFAPAVTRLLEALRTRGGPMMVSYRMNAGAVPAEHWVHGAEGGGRNLGEACHIYDLFTCLTGAQIGAIDAFAIAPLPGLQARNENFSANLRFDDGSVCNLVYTALGHGGWPKERMEVYCDGVVYALDDYRALEVSGRAGVAWSGRQDKGQRQELEALAAALRGDGRWPIPLWQQVQATRIAFAVEAALAGASAVAPGVAGVP